MHKRVPDTIFLANWWVWRTGGFGDFFPQVEKNKNSEIKIKLRKCIKECLTPFFDTPSFGLVGWNLGEK